MADDVIKLRADLENVISGKIKKISADLHEFEGAGKRAMHGVNDASKQWVSTFEGFVKAQIIMGAARQFTTLLRDSIRVYGVQVQAQRQLTAALGYSNSALFEHASAMQQVTTFGDEEVIQAQSMIAAFVKEEDSIKALTEAALDLATAKGMKVTAAADLLTKSVASSTNSLTRYGIQVEGTAGSTERINSAVQNVTKAFGGMARAMAKTDVGKLEQTENIIGDINEEIGEELLPYLQVWKEVQLDILKAVKDVAHFFGMVTDESEQITRDQIKHAESVAEQLKKEIALRKEGVDYATESGSAWEASLKHSTKSVADLEQQLRITEGYLQRMRGTAGEVGGNGDPDPDPTGTPGGSKKKTQEEIDAEVAKAAQRNVDALLKIKNNQLAKEEAIWEGVVETAQSNVDKLNEIDATRTANARKEADSRTATQKAEQEAIVDITSEGLDIITTLVNAFIEDERTRTYTLAIIKSAQATANLVSLAMEDSDSWYEAVAKGLASVGEIAAIWAPILADISSAATGADFIATRPQLLMVGDNPTRQERVTVTPIGSPNINGPRGGGSDGASAHYHFHDVSPERIVRALRDAKRSGYNIAEMLEAA